MEHTAPPAAARRTAVLDRSTTPAPVAPSVRRARRSPDWLLLAACVVAVALAVSAAALLLKARTADRAESARTEAVAAAESRAVDLLGYDYRHLDRDFARAKAGLTGSFRGDYAETTESVVRPTAEKVHAVVTAEVAASSVVSSSQNRVVVLLFVNQTTTSTRVQGPQVDLNRVRMTMDRVGGDWKVSKVTAL